MIKQFVIKPLRGINDILLGSNQDEVFRMLGKPDNSGKCDIPECDFQNDDIGWEYHDFGLEFTFSADDNFLLNSITVTSESATLYDCCLVGLVENDFLHKIQKICPFPTSLEDDLPNVNSRNYRIEDLGLDFWVHNGLLEAITIYPEYDKDTETPMYPRSNQT